MKKIFTTISLFLVLLMTTIGVNAEEIKMRSIEEVIVEIRTDLGITETDVIDLSLVKIELIEELGDSVMEAYIGNSIMHEQMDEYYGGDDSETLSNLHIQIGQDYLNGYPITMMSFMYFDNTNSNDTNRSFGGMMGRNNGYGYNGMMGTYDNSNYGNQSNSGFGMMGRNNGSGCNYSGMMGTYNNSNYENQSNTGFGMMGRNYNSSNGGLEYGAPVNSSYGNYGMMNNLGWGGMIMGMFGFILLVVALVYLFSSNSRNQGLPLSNSALNIAKERYARGEITHEEFLQITSTLR